MAGAAEKIKNIEAEKFLQRWDRRRPAATGKATLHEAGLSILMTPWEWGTCVVIF
ncbi:MAG: hypothetical protein ACPGXX_18930 [Planctomycetaceae bacterium]|jgi:hypothetical protein